MPTLRKTRIVIETREVIRVHSGAIELPSRCPLCGHEAAPAVPESTKQLGPGTGLPPESNSQTKKNEN